MLSKRKSNSKKKSIKQTPKVNKSPVPASPEVQSYMANIKSFSQADRILIVLDARNPISCRYPPYEELFAGKIMFVLNKIDLIPRESSIGWTKYFAAIAPTYAVSAINSVEALADGIISASQGGSPPKICICGVGKVGKMTIANSLKKLSVDASCSQSWNWLTPTPDLCSIGAIDIGVIQANVIASARDLLNRCSIHSLMAVFSITFFGDVDCIFTKIDRSKRGASIALFRGISSGKLKLYAVPPAHALMAPSNFSSTQEAAFLCSKPSDVVMDEMIMLGYGTPNSLRSALVQSLHEIAAKE